MFRLADVMRDFAPVDWQIAGICCQLSWNLIASSTSSPPPPSPSAGARSSSGVVIAVDEYFQQHMDELVALKRILTSLLGELAEAGLYLFYF